MKSEGPDVDRASLPVGGEVGEPCHMASGSPLECLYKSSFTPRPRDAQEAEYGPLLTSPYYGADRGMYCS